MSDNIYFANKEGDELLACLENKKQNFYNYVRNTGLYNLWKTAHNQYYKASLHGGNVSALGENGEYSGLYVNDYRNLLGQLVNITISQRPAFQARATNTDYSSQAQARLANGLLDYYMREKRLEKFVKKAVELAVSTFGRGYISIFWDADLGQDYGADENGNIIKEGDMVFRNHDSIDVIRDPMAKSHSDCDWFIVRTFQNKYDLATKFTNLKDDILNLSYNTKDKINEIYNFNQNMMYQDETDLIPVYEFFHKKTSAIPEGKYVLYLDSNILLIDSPLPYKDIPLYSVSTGEVFGTPFDYTVGYDMLPLQKWDDTLYSSAATNQKNGSVSNMVAQRGSNISLRNLTSGLNVIETDNGVAPPQILNLLQTPPEVFAMIDRLSQKMQMLSGINNVILGNPDPSLKSGAALALVASQAYQSSLPLQNSYVQMLEDLGTGIINILKEFAQTKRVAMISGLSNSGYMAEFNGKDLSLINRVIVDIGNPLSNSVSGRLELASNIINLPPEWRDQYSTILNTGRYENVIEGNQAELMLIKSENERLQKGERCQAMVTDNQVLHIKEHKVLFSSPEARENPQLVSNGLEHIQQHIDFLKTGDPDLLMILGEQPLQQKQAQPNNQVMDNQPDIVSNAQDVNMPSMPTNPMTGEEFQPIQ